MSDPVSHPPLALHIYEKHPTTDAYYVGGSYTPYAVVGRDVRFTDGELAAEYHGQTNRILLIEEGSPHGSAGPSAYRKLEALHRFATLPHYDEAEV